MLDQLEIIETTLLRGTVKLRQPKLGFHASPDSVFLSAAVPVKEGWDILDIGCGVGSVGLCITLKNKNKSLVGLDIQGDLTDLAQQNDTLSGCADRCQFFAGDLKNETQVPDNIFHSVVMNPPYQEKDTHSPSPEPIKALSHGEEASGADLVDWVKYAHRKVIQGGFLTLIHRADRLDDIIMALTARRWFGSLVIYPLYSRAGDDAKRVIIRTRRERYAPTILKSGLIVHQENGQYTKAAADILDGKERINLG